MRTSWTIRHGAPLALALLTALACGDNATSPVSGTFDDVFASGGDFADIQADSAVVDSTTSSEVIGNENWICTTKTYDVTDAPSDFPLFDPNSEIIFAGNLLQGVTLDQATPNPIPVHRGPGTVVVTLVNGAPLGVSRTVPEVSISNVYDAVNAIIAQNPGVVPARFSFTMERVDSKEQMAAAMDVSYKNLFGSVASALSFSENRHYNRFLVRLTQSYYSVAFQLPTAADNLFASDVTPADLAAYVGPGNPAAFISSVTYGRIFYLLVESTEQVDSMAASINASFGGFKGSASGKYVGELQNLVVKAFALGSDAGAALSAVTVPFSALPPKAISAVKARAPIVAPRASPAPVGGVVARPAVVAVVEGIPIGLTVGIIAVRPALKVILRVVLLADRTEGRAGRER